MEAGRSRYILVVDDSPTMRMLLVMTLKKVSREISIEEAVNGVDAWRKLQEKAFDLVFTDMQMPEMDGAELVRRIRGELSRTLPVIIVTTKGEESDRDFGLALGADGYITKPVNVHEIKETVLNYLEGHKVSYD
jgi:CheY-like chemotaxis protein